jgi:hypothetical protein
MEEKGRNDRADTAPGPGFFSITPWDHRQLMQCKEALATVADKFLPGDKARQAYVLGHWSVKACLQMYCRFDACACLLLTCRATTGASHAVVLVCAHVITWSDWWSERTEGTHHHKSHAWSFRWSFRWVVSIVQMYHLLSCDKTANSQRDRRSINVIFCCYNHTCTFFRKSHMHFWSFTWRVSS